MKQTSTFLTAVGLLVVFLSQTSTALASGLSISPLLIDRELESRDVITEDITLTNDTNTKLAVYATVNEVAVDTTGEVKEFVSPVMTDRTNTVTSWVEITRGRIELNPGETTTVPLTVRVHPFAQAGEYHVFIGFVATSKRYEAEAIAMAGNADGVIVKLTLEDKVSEALRISGFLIDRFIVADDGRSIDVEVENSGDVATVPSGEIIFYNSRGEELSAIAINEQQESVPAGETRILKSVVPFESELGRFKANVALNYGNNQQATIFDTTQFYMVPPMFMIIAGIAILFFSVLIAFLIRRAFYDELHDEDDDVSSLPLYVRSDREHTEKDHDIHLSNTK